MVTYCQWWGRGCTCIQLFMWSSRQVSYQITDGQTDRVTTVGTLSGFQDFILQPIKHRPNIYMMKHFNRYILVGAGWCITKHFIWPTIAAVYKRFFFKTFLFETSCFFWQSICRPEPTILSMFLITLFLHIHIYSYTYQASIDKLNSNWFIPRFQQLCLLLLKGMGGASFSQS